MKPSQFMDKQIMDLAGSSSATGGNSAGELLDLMNPREDQYRHGGSSNNGSGVMKEDILPSYDFRPIRTGGYANHGSGTNLDGAARSWGSGDSKLGSDSTRYPNTLEPHEQQKANHEMERNAYDVATVSEIDQTVKKYADNLLHTLEGVSSRLVQLESRTRHLETSVDELKVTVGNNSGSTDGKLRQLENILREVQTGIQVLRDKQEIADAEKQLSKHQHSSKQDQPPPPPPESSAPAASQEAPSLPYFQPPLPPQQPFQPPQQPFQPPPQPFQPPPPPQQQFQQPPPPQQPFQQPPPPQQPFQPPMPPQQPFQPPMPPQQSAPSIQTQSSLSSAPPQSLLPPNRPSQTYQLPQYPPQMPAHQEEPSHYAPHQQAPPRTYPQNIRQPEHYYGPQADPSYPYSSGSPTQYSGSAMKQQMPFADSPPLSRSGSSAGNYSRLPTAKILPQAAGSAGGGSSGNKVPVDDVVEKVATMGFSREQVRAAVRKLTENGQSVDLNVVLDKLMNEGGGDMIQPQKGWFGR